MKPTATQMAFVDALFAGPLCHMAYTDDRKLEMLEFIQEYTIRTRTRAKKSHR